MAPTACSPICALDGHDDPALDEAVRALEEAGHPVVRITLAGRDRLGQEFVRWEIATAVAGAVIGINPFDQPDVEASKIKARALTDAFEATGAVAAGNARPGGRRPAPVRRPRQRRRAGEGRRRRRPWAPGSGAHFARAGEGDYIGAPGLSRPQPGPCAALDDLRARLRDRHTARHRGRLRAAVPAFHRPGLQGRPQQRRVPADHRRSRRTTCRSPAARPVSAWSRRPRPAATWRCWPNAGGVCCASTWAATSKAAWPGWPRRSSAPWPDRIARRGSPPFRRPRRTAIVAADERPA